MRFQTPEKKSEKTISGKHAPLFCRFGRIFYLCGFDPNFMTRINTPKEVLALAGSSAADKLQNTAGKTLILAFLAGAYIAIGGLFSLMAGSGSPERPKRPDSSACCRARYSRWDLYWWYSPEPSCSRATTPY